MAGSDGLETTVKRALLSGATVRGIELTGSRARGEETDLSDWDFRVYFDDFAAVARELPRLAAGLAPLAQQWDPLSEEQCYMLMLPGPTKVDFLFHEPHEAEPPWEPSRETLGGIDRHFWDWVLWLASKEEAGRSELVRTELEKMWWHLLGPMGVERAPRSLGDAVPAYLARRRRFEQRFGLAVPRALEDEVTPVLARRGH